jgi:exodeoxyribonuclease V alpha subunit
MEQTTVSGYVEHIIYRNSENGYTVMEVATKEKTLTLVGTLMDIEEGECVEVSGHMIQHPVYGEQFSVSSFVVKPPEDLASIERYLASGAIKGVGPTLAGRIVEKFQKETFRIIEEEPERLAEVYGISEKKALSIGEQALTQRERRQAIIFLQNYGIGMNLALKIYQYYQNEIYSLLKVNPYKIAEDVPGVGFKIADDIATKVGIEADSDFRIRSAILYVLTQAIGSGHIYLPSPILAKEAGALLGIALGDLEPYLQSLVFDRKIVVRGEEDLQIVYAQRYYQMEVEVAGHLLELNQEYGVSESDILIQVHQIERDLDITLDEQQKNAVCEAVNNGVLVLTGGPGTGKTTTIQSILEYFEREDMIVALAAPTGRAAKRMSEATGREARTIHRLLELNGVPGEDSSVAGFNRNAENPLEADVIIIDEMSMVDISLMNALLRAVVVGTRLILVGDVDQLPSVGPGNVLKDIIASRAFPVVKLEKIFRQAAMSDIIVNAHKINDGEFIDPTKRSKDFLFISRPDANSIINACITLVQKKLPSYIHADAMDIQIMTPMRKGALGVERLNIILQQYLNPPAENKREKEVGGTVYRLGDKVMQIKNNYKLEWEVRNKRGFVIETGMGVFNGDIGKICNINLYAEELTVEFEEGKRVLYSFKQLEELELAYAVTVHKSQGSEYPAVVLPLLTGPHMLMNRNLLYTAVTRAKSCVCIVGSVDTFTQMVHNEREQRRYSSLALRIHELENI